MIWLQIFHLGNKAGRVSSTRTPSIINDSLIENDSLLFLKGETQWHEEQVTGDTEIELLFLPQIRWKKKKTNTFLAYKKVDKERLREKVPRQSYDASHSDLSCPQSPYVALSKQKDLTVAADEQKMLHHTTGKNLGLLHTQETESWRSRWLPSSDVMSPGGLNPPDLRVCLTRACTQETHHNMEHAETQYPSPQMMVTEGNRSLHGYWCGIYSGVHMSTCFMGSCKAMWEKSNKRVINAKPRLRYFALVVVLLVRKKWLRNHLQSEHEVDDISKQLNRASIHHGRCCRGVMCYIGTNQQFPTMSVQTGVIYAVIERLCHKVQQQSPEAKYQKNQRLCDKCFIYRHCCSNSPETWMPHTHTRPSQHHRRHIRSILPFVPKLWCGIIARWVFLVNIIMSQWSWLVTLGT